MDVPRKTTITEHSPPRKNDIERHHKSHIFENRMTRTRANSNRFEIYSLKRVALQSFNLFETLLQKLFKIEMANGCLIYGKQTAKRMLISLPPISKGEHVNS